MTELGFSYPRVFLYRRIVQAKLFIDKKYAEPINVDDIADEAFFSKFHFIRQFSSVYGRTPHQYLRRVRIEKAKILLNDGLSISETCYSVGFESVSSFSGLFKKMVGKSPSEYLEERKKVRSQIEAAPLTAVPNCFAEHKGWVNHPDIKKSNFGEEVLTD